MPRSRLSAVALLALPFVAAAPMHAQPPVATKPPIYVARVAPRIPNVVGMPVDSAITALALTRLTIVRLDSMRSGRPLGSVVAQRPAAGTYVGAAKAETLWVAALARRLPPGAVVTLPPGVLVPPAQNPPNADDLDDVQRWTVVPSLYGGTRNMVSAALEKARLKLGRVSQDSSDEMPAGRVFRQYPAAQTPVGLGRPVDVWYSLGPHRKAVTIVVPPIEKLTLAEARDVLAKFDLRLGRVATERRSGADGRIVHQEPHAGSRAHPDDSVDVTLALEPLPITVPGVIGLSSSDARVRIEAAGLEVGAITVVTRDGATGTIETQRPAAGASVPPRSPIDLVEARAPEVVLATVPALIGTTQADAERRLTAVGLTLGVVVRPDENPAAKIVAQDPPAGQRVPLPARVNVRIAGRADTLIRVPRITGLTVGEAQRTLGDSGLSRILISGDSTTAASVVVAQAPLAGALVGRDALVTLIAESVVGSIVPSLVDRTEADAQAEARRDNFSMHVKDRRRGLRLTDRVVRQVPIAGARDRGDHRIDVDLAIPIVPPVPAAILLGLAGVTGEAVRRWRRKPDAHERQPDAHAPELVVSIGSLTPDEPMLAIPEDRLVETAIDFSYELDAPAWDVDCSGGTLISSEKVVSHG